MNKISIIYNKEIIKDKKLFNKTVKIFKSFYDDDIIFKSSKDTKFQIIFNNKIIYSLDDNFDSDALIDKDVLIKANNYIENAIKLNKSKDISRVDDIGIDDF
mgnify:CR=1 FL=1|tara:strand:- start:6 stop:311 length:306 start_codon:yes stop_codon:yes gene_type:complete